MAKYPIFLELSGRHVVLVGGGTVAFRKAQSLIDAGARLVVVAKHVDDALEALCQSKGVRLVKGSYAKEYLVGAVLAIAATNDTELNKQVYKDCQELEVLCNVVDVPDLCDFFVPALVERGQLQIAIGTGGHSPAFAGHMRKKLEEIVTQQHGQFLDELDAIRKVILDRIPESNDRKILAGVLVDDKSFELFVGEGAEAWRTWANKKVEECEAGV
jgi:siroheme synthase-like protein